MTNVSILEQAAKSVLDPRVSKPPAAKVVEALLQAEKTARTEKIRYSFEQLIGSWRLCFITGTQKTRAKAGIVMGAGRYIPQFVKIQASYSPVSIESQQQNFEAGLFENGVAMGSFQLVLTGPTKFLNNKNILAFDFTKVKVQLLGAKLYSGAIRGGEAKEQDFYTESVGKQAFFAYFLIGEQAIAARGRGGGLALWAKQA